VTDRGTLACRRRPDNLLRGYPRGKAIVIGSPSDDNRRQLAAVVRGLQPAVTQ